PMEDWRLMPLCPFADLGVDEVKLDARVEAVLPSSHRTSMGVTMLDMERNRLLKKDSTTK
ncbi:hypothetical protein ZWY2020_010957, partial [Hordeum vulgare]